MANLPLEYNSTLKTKYNLDQNQVLDFSQIYSLLYSNFNLNFLYHDNATNIFSSTFNNPDYQIFEIIIYNLLNECRNNNIQINFYHIKNKRDESEYDIKEYSIDLKVNNQIIDIQPKNNSRKPKFIQPPINLVRGVFTLALFEYDEDDFGHYGTMFYDSEYTINIFDSMMQSKKEKISTPYNFEDIFIKKIFNVNGANIHYDIYCDVTDNIYSLEITGGSYNVKNPKINKLKDNVNKFNQYLMGVDNQNQFCYMWSFLYIIFNISRIINPHIINFSKLHKKIIDNNIIPVVAIKIFILILLKYYDCVLFKSDFDKVKTLLIDEQFFIDNFRKIITNNIAYTEIYNDINTQFNCVQFNFILPIDYKTSSFTDICLTYITTLDNITYINVLPILIPDVVKHVQAGLEEYKRRENKDIYNDITQIKSKNDIHKYLLYLLDEQYEDLGISKIDLHKKTSRRKPKYGGNKYDLYKFINLDL